MYLVLDFSFCKPVLFLRWSLLHSLPYILISQSLSLSHPHYQIMRWIRIADRLRNSCHWNPKVRYRAHTNTLLVPVVNQLNQSTPFNLTSVRYIAILSFHLRLGLSGFLFLSAFMTKTVLPFVFCPMRATCTAHVIVLDLITQNTSTISFETFSDPPLASLFYY